MLLEKHIIPVPLPLPSWHILRVLRVASYSLLLFLLTQLVSPASLGWQVPLTVVESGGNDTAVHMAHQPLTVTQISDLWSLHAAHPMVAPIIATAPWIGQLESIPSPTIYGANLHLERDMVAQFSDGAVNLFVEQNTFETSTRLEFTPIWQNGRQSAAQEEEETFFRFQLEARNSESGELYGEFSQPIRLTLDFDEIGIDLSENHGELFLAYRDEENPLLWHHVDIEVYEEANVISADVMHFSDWVAGERPEAWGLSWSPPTVSEFSGAVTYGYPINVPPGRAGLQPSVGLSYNSRNMDGTVRNMDEGFVANGWSLAQMGIFRSNVHGNNANDMEHPDIYSLVIDGTGYDLYLGSGQNADNVTANYYAANNPQLFIQRHYDSGSSSTYWIVKNGSGRTYKFGGDASAETWQCTRDGMEISFGRDRGTLRNCPDSAYHHQSPTGWYVTEVTDYFGNKMVYQYADNYADMETGKRMLTQKARITDIYYNYELDNPSQAGSHIAFRPATTDPIESIYIYHGGTESGRLPLGEYRLKTAERSMQSPGCRQLRLPDRWGIPDAQDHCDLTRKHLLPCTS